MSANNENKRKADRVEFSRAVDVHMMAIDGTWRRSCTMNDVAADGAKLTIEGSIQGLKLEEFFLILSTTGLAYRRCELAWVDGVQIGVRFIKATDRKRKPGNSKARRPSSADPDDQFEV